MTVHAWATKGPNQRLVPYTYEAGELAADDVEIAVENCGLCHSDVSVMNNEWGISQVTLSFPATKSLAASSRLARRQKASRSASAWGSAGVQGASPRRRCRARANSHQRLRYHHDATERIRFAKRVATIVRTSTPVRLN